MFYWSYLQKRNDITPCRVGSNSMSMPWSTRVAQGCFFFGGGCSSSLTSLWWCHSTLLRLLVLALDVAASDGSALPGEESAKAED